MNHDMRKSTFITLSIVISFFSQAQEQNANLDPNQDPDWSVLMQDPNVDFEELTQLFEDRWANREITKGCGYKPFKRWEQLMQSRLNEEGKVLRGKDYWKAYTKLSQEKSLNGQWRPLGPILDDVTTRETIRGVGRMNYVAFHPNDPNIVFAGAPSGGVWRSYDGGRNWVSNTDNLPVLGVSSIGFDYQNPDIVYVGTGDRDGNDSPGMGIMKSIDGGLTWELANAGIEELTVGDIAVDPINSNIVLAATSQGIWRSEDGAETWTLESNNLNYKEIAFKPGDSQIVYASGGGRFYRSSNNGQTWQYINDGIIQGTRMVIGVSPADPEVVYALRASTYSFQGFYKSTDSGQNFVEMSDEPNILSWSASGDQEGGQAWFDLCLTVDPNDADVVYVGGIRMKKSVDGGATWLDIQNNYLHVDQHWLEFSPHTDELFLANDGGMYVLENGADWLDVSDGIVTGQIYKLGQSPHSPVKTLCGFQDNGTYEFTGSIWDRRGGGDGFEAWYDQEDPEWWFNSLYYGRVYRTGPNLSNQQICGDGVLGIDEEGAWSAPYSLSRFDNNTMYSGLKNVWRTRNIKTPTKDDIVWERISFDLGGDNNSNLNNLEESRADSNMVWVSKGARRLYLTMNALAPVDSVEWIDLSNSLPWQNFPVTAIETHPLDSATLYIGFNAKVFKSNDRGETWEEWIEGLPGVPVNDILLDLTSDEGLYVATDLGVFYKDASMTEFVSFNQGLPVGSRATELDIYYGENASEHRLKCSTYGRGLWESDLYGEGIQAFPSTAVARTTQGEQEVYGDFDVDVFFYKNLQNVEVDELLASEIQVENADVVSFTGDGINFTFTLSPMDFGLVNIFIPAEVVSDLNGILNMESDTLSVVYRAVPEPFGIYGPGGVGDEADMAVWLDAGFNVLDQDGNQVVEEGGAIANWGDRLLNGLGASQLDQEFMPTLALGDNGINDMPALSFDGENDVMVMNGLPSPENPSMYAIAKAAEQEFNDHGWIASSRMPNGYVLHPWAESALYHSIVIDEEGNYADGPQQWVVDAGAPHIYGTIYERTDFASKFETVFDGITLDWNGAGIGPRQDGALIDVNFGLDFDERFGHGLISEHFIYNKRTLETHRKLICSYLAVKYGIDIGPTSKFSLSAYPNEAAGIGKESEVDEHTVAQGTGIVKMSEAGGLSAGEYLMWAHDAGALIFEEGSFPITSNRLNRTWGYEETGDCGDVLFEIDLSSIDQIPDGIGVIIETSPFFFVGGEPTFMPLTDNGGGWYSANIDFWNKGVFTIGTSPSVGLEDLQLGELTLYPNPAYDKLTVEFPVWPDLLQVEILNSVGQVMDVSSFTGGQIQLDVSGLACGLYFLRIRNEEQAITSRFAK